MLIELFKNAVRATVEKHIKDRASGGDANLGTFSAPPSVEVQYWKQDRETTIKIIDKVGVGCERLLLAQGIAGIKALCSHWVLS